MFRALATAASFALFVGCGGSDGNAKKKPSDPTTDRAALLQPAPVGGVAWVVVDEWSPGSWWDGTDRVLDIELVP